MGETILGKLFVKTSDGKWQQIAPVIPTLKVIRKPKRPKLYKRLFKLTKGTLEFTFSIKE